MVMKELDKPRETYILKRGVYDQPDKSRPVSRAIPVAFGKLPEAHPPAALPRAVDHVARRPALRTRHGEPSVGDGVWHGPREDHEDFGLQGDFPSHPELLDWLAVEFRESGWDVQHMLRLIVTSDTYRRSSATRPDLAEKDPENRLLSHFPRRRLTAEQIRDQALFVSGLLVERAGGLP
jgi:hypothetical protein